MATKRYIERYIELLQLRHDRAEFHVSEVRKEHEIKVHDAKISVENLVAPQANLGVGSAEYEQIQYQLTQARETYDARSRELDLETRKAQRIADDIAHDIKEASSASGKFRVLVGGLALVELIVLWLVLQYGEGANLLQQTTHSISLFPAAFTLWLILSYWWLGLQGIRALGWPVLKLFREETPGDSV